MPSTPTRRPSATLDQVAQAAGVSRATASRAINGSGPVSRQSQQAVDRAVRKLGFQPNRAAQTLASRRTDAIALVVPEPNAQVLADPFIAGTINGISTAFANTRMQLLLLIAPAPGASVAKIGRFISRGHVDGAILLSQHHDDMTEQVLAQAGIPTVIIGRPWVGWSTPSPTPFIDLDNIEGGRLATRRLIDIGRRRIACLAGPADMTAPVDRIEGWRIALDAAKLTPGPLAHAAKFTMKDSYAAMEQLLAADPALDAVFAHSDLLAAGALRILAAAGRRVPDDVAVVGYDDFDVATTTTPQLTTVHNPVSDMSARAAAALVAQLTTGQPIVSQVLAPTLHIRESA